jgi:hypothetical protein
MTFGRPAMIGNSSDGQLPLLIDDEYLRTDAEGIQPQGLPSLLGMFVYSSILFEILNESLVLVDAENRVGEQLHQNRPAEKPQRLLTNVLTLNRRLDEFFASLPDYLQLHGALGVSGAQIAPTHLRLQKEVLHCRSGLHP